jgi:hypothetical protein
MQDIGYISGRIWKEKCENGDERSKTVTEAAKIRDRKR